jgi:hypothetical protein
MKVKKIVAAIPSLLVFTASIRDGYAPSSELRLHIKVFDCCSGEVSETALICCFEAVDSGTGLPPEKISYVFLASSLIEFHTSVSKC